MSYDVSNLEGMIHQYVVILLTDSIHNSLDTVEILQFTSSAKGFAWFMNGNIYVASHRSLVRVNWRFRHISYDIPGRQEAGNSQLDLQIDTYLIHVSIGAVDGT